MHRHGDLELQDARSLAAIEEWGRLSPHPHEQSCATTHLEHLDSRIGQAKATEAQVETPIASSGSASLF